MFKLTCSIDGVKDEKGRPNSHNLSQNTIPQLIMKSPDDSSQLEVILEVHETTSQKDLQISHPRGAADVELVISVTDEASFSTHTITKVPSGVNQTHSQGSPDS